MFKLGDKVKVKEGVYALMFHRHMGGQIGEIIGMEGTQYVVKFPKGIITSIRGEPKLHFFKEYLIEYKETENA